MAIRGMMVVGALILASMSVKADEITLKKGARVHKKDLAGLKWFPLIKLASSGQKGAALLYASMKTRVLAGKTYPWFDRFFLITDWKDGDFDVNDIFTVSDTFDGRVLSKVEGVPVLGSQDVVIAKFKQWNGTGFDADFRLLYDATRVVRSKFKTRTFAFEINVRGEPIVTWRGQEIYFIEAVPNTIAGQPVGISKLRFYGPKGEYLETSSL